MRVMGLDYGSKTMGVAISEQLYRSLSCIMDRCHRIMNR